MEPIFLGGGGEIRHDGLGALFKPGLLVFGRYPGVGTFPGVSIRTAAQEECKEERESTIMILHGEDAFTYL